MKIALLGSHPASTNLAPFQDITHTEYLGGRVQAYPPPKHGDQRWLLWGCSPAAFASAPRADAWFEVHRWEPGAPWFSPEYCQFLREFKGPVYIGGPIPEITRGVVYPRPEIEAEFSAYFLTSSISLMAAIAIKTIEAVRAWRAWHRLPPEQRLMPEPLEPFNRMGIPREWVEPEIGQTDQDDIVGMWGIDMSAQEEYMRQKPGAWFFGLEAMRRGIGVIYPPESDLFCSEPIYGLSEWDHDYIQATTRMRNHNQRLQDAQNRMAQVQNEINGINGMKGELAYQITNWKSPYRLPPGCVNRMIPGTGLGSGIELIDGKPVNQN